MRSRWARIGFWTSCIVALFTVALAVAAGISGHWLLLGWDCALTGLDLNSARIFRKHRPLTTPNQPVASRHEQCLASIDVLERQLADDGVLFLKTPEDFDREVAKILPGPVARDDRVGAAADRRAGGPKMIPQGLSPKKLCPVSGMQYGTCPCDPRWASLRQCPAH